MKKDEVIPSLVWISIGISICIASTDFKLGSWSSPQPGLFPFLIGCGIIAFSVFNVIPQLLEKSDEGKSRFHLNGLKRVFIVIALIAFYALGLERFGYLLCSYIFFFALFKILGRKSWRYAIFTSFILTILSYVFFEILIKSNLPKGFLMI